MDISNWPLGKIMQLPDHCFGRRWPVFCGVESETDIDHYAIVGAGIPDRAVIWEISVFGRFTVTNLQGIEFAWADVLVTTAAQWTALQKMFPCQGVKDGLDYNIWCSGSGDFTIRRLKFPSPAAGQKPTMRSDGASTTASMIGAVFIVSSIPKEVPDCLLSV